MANWARGILQRTGLVVTPEARAVGRAQRELHDRIALNCRLLIDVLGWERRDLPLRLRRYVGASPGSVKFKRSWRRDILDWLRYRYASPSLARLAEDAALCQAVLAGVLAANEKARAQAERPDEPHPAVRRFQ